jgi:chitodextrinase
MCLGTLGVAPSAAFASSPLPAPTSLQAVHVADTSADLTWLSNGASAQDVLEVMANGAWQEYARGLFGSISLTGLSRATTYTFRVYSIPVQGLGYTTSAPSAPVTFTTLPAPDTVPPSKPPAPTFSSTTTTATNVSWGAATDNVQVTGYYLQQLVGGGWSTIRAVGAAARFQSISGLSPATSYTFAVVAFDARGNTSARSDPGTVTTLASTPAPACQVQVLTYSPGFTANLTITNTTATPINGWTIQFTLPATATASPFGGVLNRNGTVGTITPFSYNSVIGVGLQTFVGFTGSVTPFTPPADFTFNGLPCTSG